MSNDQASHQGTELRVVNTEGGGGSPVFASEIQKKEGKDRNGEENRALAMPGPNQEVNKGFGRSPCELTNAKGGQARSPHLKEEGGDKVHVQSGAPSCRART